MPQFIFQKYVDKDFEDKQQYISEISDRVTKIALDSIKSDEEFISQSVLQAKTYSQLIIELFDYIENLKRQQSSHRDENEKQLMSVLSPLSNRPKSNRTSARGSITEALINGDSRYLEQKIEYLNGQISKHRKTIDVKAIEVENLQGENSKLLEKIEFLNKNSSSIQFKEENQKQVTELKKAIQRAEDETKELLEINFELKDKYKDLEAEFGRKKREFADILNKIDPEYVEKLENENRQLREQNEFSEKLEDIDKLKEIISERDAQCANLQSQLETKSKKGQSANILLQQKETAKLVNRIVQRINELMQKKDVRDENLKEIPSDSPVQEQDGDFLVNRINSKLIDVSDALGLLFENQPSQKSTARNDTPCKPLEDLRSINGTSMGLFSKVLESAQLLRDQIEADTDRQILIDQSKALFQDLLILFHGLKQVGTAPTKRILETSQEVSHFNQSIWIGNETRSPSKLSVRNNLAKTQEEISNKLKHSLETLRVSNHNDVTQQLQLQMDRYNELNDKYESIKKSFHTASLIIKEEVVRCVLSLDDVLSINSDNGLLLRLQRDLSNFKTQIGSLFARQGQFYDPQNEYTEVQCEFDRQRTVWETSLNRQKDCFVEEIRKLEDSLLHERRAYKKEKETSTKLITKLESEVSTLRAERDRLSTEVEQLRITLKDEKFSAEEVQRRQQHDLELEKQTSTRLQAQINDLQKFIEEREAALLQGSSRNTELHKKCTELELEVLKLSRECQFLQKDKRALVEQISQNEKNLKELGNRVEVLEQHITVLEKERERLTKELAENEKTYELDRDHLANTLELVQKEYQSYVERTKSNTSVGRQTYDDLINEYSKKLEQQKNEYETYRQSTATELREKKDELRELNFKFQTLKDLSGSQETNLKKRDEKIEALIEERKLLQEKVLSFELVTREAACSQEKSKKYLELLTNANAELENSRSDFQALAHEKKELEARETALESENEKLREEIEQLKENFVKTSKKLNESLSETKVLREQIETEQQNTLRKEKELKFLNEANTKQSSATINFKDELIQRLKEDVQSLTSEYENLRVKYQRVADRNEQLASEVQELRMISKEKEVTFKEMEELNKFNDNLLDEVRRMRSDLKKKDKRCSSTKKKPKYDAPTSQKKLRDISNRQYGDESPSSTQAYKFLTQKEKISEFFL